jgi:Ser/Thr protein kinase RdoA (MazF antagonist)
MTNVERVGDSVRRDAGPWTETVQALLAHVRARGIDWVPEPGGRDDRGREVLGYVEGDVHDYPLPEWMWDDAVLEEAARRLRLYHDATVGFARAGRRWRLLAHTPDEVVCHNDFAPYNLLFDGGRLTGVIDFDMASPGPRVRDMAYAAYRFAPLTDPANPDVPFRGLDDQARRLAAFCAAYGDPRIRPADVVEAAIARLRELVAFIVESAAAGDPAQRAVLARGDVAIYERDTAHLDRHRDRLGL